MTSFAEALVIARKLDEMRHGGGSDDAYDALIGQLAAALDAGQVEQLSHLFRRGPVHDGDVISKAGRDDLVRLGLAHRVLDHGRWGYNACTYRGGHVLLRLAERAPRAEDAS